MCAASRSKHSCSVSCENLIAPLSIIRWRASSGWTTSAWKERLVAERAARWRALSQCSKTHVEDTQSRLVATCRISRRRTSSGSAARQRADSSIRRTLRELCALEPNYCVTPENRLHRTSTCVSCVAEDHSCCIIEDKAERLSQRARISGTHTSHIPWSIPWYRSPLPGCRLAGACLTTPDADACAQTNLTPDMREDLPDSPRHHYLSTPSSHSLRRVVMYRLTRAARRPAHTRPGRRARSRGPRHLRRVSPARTRRLAS